MTTLLLATNGNQYLEECKGLVWEVASARYFWKRTVVSHPGYCSSLAESAMYLRSAIASDTWLKIHRKRTGEDHTIKIIYRFSQG